MTKQDKIQCILEDVSENPYESQTFLLDLAEEALNHWPESRLNQYLDKNEA